MKKTLVYFILFLSFYEGFSVMACELISAKLVAPYFGSSLYVWSAVLGITLLALMSGYYFGGWLSEKAKNTYKTSLIVLTLGGFFMAIMPLLGNWIMKSTLEMDITKGVTISLILFMLPPLFFFGTTSPMLIEVLNKNNSKAGKAAGTIYAISTFGGILATFLCGFYLIPEYGLRTPSMIIGGLMILFVGAGFYMTKKMINVFANVIIILGLFFSHVSVSKAEEDADFGEFDLLYKSEGVFGQIKVVDKEGFVCYWRGGPYNARMLLVNNSAQSYAFADNPSETLWDWAYFYKAFAALPENKDNALLLGLGGGSFYHQLVDLGYQNIDVVELDERIKDVAIEFFGVPKNANIHVDDARHYLNINQKKYDVIMMDLFRNEVPATNCLTLESFKEVKRSLNKNGVVILNFYGYLSDEKGYVGKSLIKTMLEAGFEVDVIPTPNPKENERNLIVVASHDQIDMTKLSVDLVQSKSLPSSQVTTEMFDQSIIYQIQRNAMKFGYQDLKKFEVFVDDVPRMERLFLDLALEWRKDVTFYNTQHLIKYNL